jgi:hypothetical protein
MKFVTVYRRGEGPETYPVFSKSQLRGNEFGGSARLPIGRPGEDVHAGVHREWSGTGGRSGPAVEGGPGPPASDLESWPYIPSLESVLVANSPLVGARAHVPRSNGVWPGWLWRVGSDRDGSTKSHIDPVKRGRRLVIDRSHLPRADISGTTVGRSLRRARRRRPWLANSITPWRDARRVYPATREDNPPPERRTPPTPDRPPPPNPRNRTTQGSGPPTRPPGGPDPPHVPLAVATRDRPARAKPEDPNPSLRPAGTLCPVPARRTHRP